MSENELLHKQFGVHRCTEFRRKKRAARELECLVTEMNAYKKRQSSNPQVNDAATSQIDPPPVYEATQELSNSTQPDATKRSHDGNHKNQDFSNITHETLEMNFALTISAAMSEEQDKRKDGSCDQGDNAPLSQENLTEKSSSCFPSDSNQGPITDAFVADETNYSYNGGSATSVGYNTLCPCSPLTDNDIILMVLAMGLRHALTWEAQLDICRLVNSIYGVKKISPTKYKYLKCLKEQPKDIDYHVYCHECNNYIGKRLGLKGCMLCTSCKKDVNVASVENFFISVSMEKQLGKLMQFPGIADLILNYRFDREKKDVDALEDILDGAEYKTHCKQGKILSIAENFSYTFFTDGISMGQTTNKTMWPIYFTVNELPPIERKKHIILAGLYVGPTDPDHTVFLKPFVENANKLSSVGFDWEYKGRKINSKVIPLVAVLDSVARFQVMNFQSFHARQGCTYCYVKQNKTIKGIKYTVDPTKEIQERTVESIKEDLKEVFARRHAVREEDRPYRGVKGVSALFHLKYFNFTSGFVVDYLHAVLNGAIQHHVNLLLSANCKKFWISSEDDPRVGMEHIIAAIDKRLLQIKPPTCITRTPRPISKRALWRANEWRSFLLFYAIPCLTGILKEKHLLHLCMLSKAMIILLQKSISKSEVLEAHKLLKCYLFHFQLYFGEEEMLYNLHLLSHLAQCVLNWGPLSATNAFLYESKNRFILQLRKSANHVALQIVKKYLAYFSFPLLCEKLSTTEKSVAFCEDVLARKLKILIRCGNTLLLGLGEIWIASYDEEETVYKFCGYRQSSCLSYPKMMHKKKRIATSDYHKDKKNDNSCIILADGRAAVIRKILMVPNRRVVLLMQRVIVRPTPFLEDKYVKLDHISRFQAFGGLFCIDPSCIDEYGIYMTVESGVFLSAMPFGCYGD